MNASSLAVDGEIEPTERRGRYFPGWTMVGISAAAQFCSAPGQSYSVAAFKEPMRVSLDVSETHYSVAYAAATIVSGVSLPLVGRLIDRRGARRTLPTLALMLGVACLGMSQVSDLAGLYLGFTFVRSLGQGALSLVAAWLVGEWFARRRGFATALSGLGGSLSVMSVPLLNAWVIHQFGWQTGWVVMATMVWLLLLLPSLFLVRDRPEDIGWLPDGDAATELPPNDGSADASAVQDADDADRWEWTASDALRDVTFWKLLAVPATSGLVGTGLVFHAVSLLGSRGLPVGWALALISFQALIASVAALFAGWLTDRCQARYLLASGMLLVAIAGTIVLVMPWPALAIVYAVLLGLHGSILRSTGMVVWMDYYGRRHQGAIRGIAMAVMILAAAAGPLPLALSIDFAGTYDWALGGMILMPLGAAGLVWTAGPTRRRDSS